MSSLGAVSDTKPVTDSVPKVNNELAVGADLKFQQRWWKFERAVWWTFAVIVVLDLIGCFGRGPLSKAELDSRDRSIHLEYERIERYGTPSILTVHFGPDAIHDGKVQLLVSESLVKELGTERVVPQPEKSLIGNGSILYTFPASGLPASIQFGLAPARPGISHLALQVPGFETVRPTIYVMP